MTALGRRASRVVLVALLATIAIVVVSCGSVTPTPIVIFVTLPPPTAEPPSAEPTESPTSSPTPTPTPTPSPPATIDLPVLSGKVAGASKTRYYSITGNSPADLLAGLTRNCANQSWLCADTGYQWEYKSRTNLATGYCSVTSASVSYKPTARVPRWTGPAKVYPELFSWWQQVLKHITSGEAALIKIQRTADTRFPKLLVGQRCAAAKGIISKWERTNKAAYSAFYKKDATWLLPVYAGP